MKPFTAGRFKGLQFEEVGSGESHQRAVSVLPLLPGTAVPQPRGGHFTPNTVTPQHCRFSVSPFVLFLQFLSFIPFPIPFLPLCLLWTGSHSADASSPPSLPLFSWAHQTWTSFLGFSLVSPALLNADFSRCSVVSCCLKSLLEMRGIVYGAGLVLYLNNIRESGTSGDLDTK